MQHVLEDRAGCGQCGPDHRGHGEARQRGVMEEELSHIAGCGVHGGREPRRHGKFLGQAPRGEQDREKSQPASQDDRDPLARSAELRVLVKRG